MAFIVQKVEPTPNPNAVKFVLDRSIASQPISVADAESAGSHPIAARLFGIPGVTRLLLLHDFVTVNKTPSARWATIRPKVIRALADEPTI